MLRSAVVCALVLGASAHHPGDPAGGPGAHGAPAPEHGPSHECEHVINMAIHTCWPWLKETCPHAMGNRDQMGECFIEHQSNAPDNCKKAAHAAFQCEYEKKSQHQCVERFGEETVMACHQDIEAFCSQERFEGFRPTFECMMRNSEHLSEVCKADARNLVSCVQCHEAEQKAMEYCMETFVKVCKDTSEGEEEECYRENHSAFPATCHTAVSHMMNTCAMSEHLHEQADHKTEAMERHEMQHTQAEHRHHEHERRAHDMERESEDRWNEHHEEQHHRQEEAARRETTQHMPAGAERHRMERMEYELEKMHHMLEDCHRHGDRQREQYHHEATDRMETSDRWHEEEAQKHEETREENDRHWEETARAEVEHMSENPMQMEGEAMHHYHDHTSMPMPGTDASMHGSTTTGHRHHTPMTRLASLF